MILLVVLLISGLVVWAQGNSFYLLSAKTIDGEVFPFEQLRGKKVMIVNTASKCSLSPQFKALQQLHKKFADQDFVVLGFPSNDFANREPGDPEAIKSALERRFKITFQMMDKIAVRGDSIHPVYQWLTKKMHNGVKDSNVKWNFQKYLIDEYGYINDIIDPIKRPDGKAIVEWIKEE